ncbi:hypothetical protein BKP37_11015 [Anaerobacillus alkalilacustris]|uniref:Uncharacterized protein n=1 Tax=Anaerobacillus alkalilacustris TaxID=393763 RepID=A0A1S2LKR0_9BACI|nr:hypothetical protein [Anaerobacillus alkalilacustris]OIJ13041.1 hypothetical protein BKP37_11015 [Anaerobacillus alkalilacustris]
MKKSVKHIAFILIIVLLTTQIAACNGLNKNEQDGQSFIRLETENQGEEFDQIDPEEDGIDKTENELSEQLETTYELEEEEAEVSEYNEEEPGLVKEVEEIEEVEVISYPFDEFINRWNALADEIYSEMYITSLEKQGAEGNQSTYSFTFNNGFELTVSILNEEQIELMRLQGRGATEDDRYTLLTGWSQIVLMSSFYFEYYDVNQVFHNLDIGPNAAIPSNDREIEYKNVHFRLKHMENQFHFEADLRTREG